MDGLYPKKRSLGACERDEFQRAAWGVMVTASVDPRRLVFVDGMGSHTSLAPLHAYSEKGHRAYAEVPRNRGKNATLLSGMSLGGMGPSLAVEGGTDAAVFETYVGHSLGPSLRDGQIVVMDNLSAHKTDRVRELIEARGCELLYLPAYSPDFDPIEEAFSKIKGILRKAASRGKEALVKALGAALSAITARDARGFFEHAGYRSPVHLL